MPTTLSEALASEAQRDQAEAAYFDQQAARNSGVHFGGMEATRPMPRSPSDRLQAARKALQAAERRAATPGARFMACVVAAQQLAERGRNEELHRACEFARACASRGIEGELDHAEKCLAVIETLGGDVRTARAALSELVSAQLMAAE